MAPAVQDRSMTAIATANFRLRTQTEEAFGKMFEEMLGDLKGMIRIIGLAVVFSLLCVASNSMAMSMRERTSEVAVLKAIGFNRRSGALHGPDRGRPGRRLSAAAGFSGSRRPFATVVDLSKYTGGFLPFYYVPWNIALEGLAVSLFIGLASGLLSGRAGGQSARSSTGCGGSSEPP